MKIIQLHEKQGKSEINPIVIFVSPMLRCLQTVSIALSKVEENLTELENWVKVVVTPYLLPAGTAQSDIPIFWSQFRERQQTLNNIEKMENVEKLENKDNLEKLCKSSGITFNFDYLVDKLDNPEWFLDLYEDTLDYSDKKLVEKDKKILRDAREAFGKAKHPDCKYFYQNGQNEGVKSVLDPYLFESEAQEARFRNLYCYMKEIF